MILFHGKAIWKNATHTIYTIARFVSLVTILKPIPEHGMLERIGINPHDRIMVDSDGRFRPYRFCKPANMGALFGTTSFMTFTCHSLFIDQFPGLALGQENRV
jgi:hypothetical protein